MTIYIIILILLNIGFVLDFTSFKMKKYLFLFNFITIYLLASLRYEVGPDYINYREMYKNVEMYDFFTTYMYRGSEVGYWYLTFFIKKIASFQCLIFIMNCFIFYFLYKSLSKVRYKGASLLVLYSLIYMYSIFSTYRQGLVILIFLYNLENIWNRKLLKYLIFCVLGGLFHLTSFLTIPFYFILNKKYSLKLYFFVLVLAIFISRPEILNYLMRFIVNNFDNILARKINIYFFIKSNGEVSKTSLVAWVNRSLQIGWLYLFYHIKNKKLNQRETIIFNTVYLMVISFIILSPVGVIAGRISDLFEISLILFIPMLVSEIKNKKNQVILIVQFLIYLNLFFIKELNTNHGGREVKDYLPYRSIFQRE